MDSTTKHPRRTLELTILSAEDLRVDRRLNTKNLYVVVRAEAINCYTTLTAGERGSGGDGESYPSWNEKLLVDVPAHARSITLEVKCKTSSTASANNKDVAVARIAISDFLGGAVPGHCLQFLSYRLRDWEGRRNGVLNFSVRVVVKSPEIAPIPATEKVGSCGFQNMRGFPGASSSSSCSSPGGVVTGIPVMWSHHVSSNI